MRKDRQIHQETLVKDLSDKGRDHSNDGNPLKSESKDEHDSHLAVILDAEQKSEELKNNLNFRGRKKKRGVGGIAQKTTKVFKKLNPL